MRIVALFGAGLLLASPCLAQEPQQQSHFRANTLRPPAESLAPAATLAPVPQTGTDDVQAFVAAAESELTNADENTARSSFVKNTYITFDTEWIESRAVAEQARTLLGFLKGSVKYNNAVVDPVTRRKLHLLKIISAVPPPDRQEGLEELARLTSKLDTFHSGITVTYRGKVLKPDDVYHLGKTMRDPAELKELWEAVRGNLAPMRADYARSVALANEGARSLGFKDVGDLWRSTYDMPPDAFVELIDRLWLQIEPLYKNLQCYMRARLNDKYGDAEQPRTGAIRAHLLQFRWENMTDIFGPPKSAGAGYDLTKLLAAKNYDVTKMVKTGEGFFTSLGFAPLPATFWERSMFTRPRDREVGCWATSWHIDTKADVRMKACLRVDGSDFVTVHHELGHAMYYLAYLDQPYLMKGGANDGFHEAVGDFIALSAQTPTYLQQLGLLDTVPGPEGDIPFLAAMLDLHLWTFTNHLANDKWRWDVFAGAAPETYNDLYWQRQRQYRGVVPPGPRPANAFDPGLSWHVAGYIPAIRYSLAEIYQFQFHRAACRMAGWTGPLHRCSIYGNKEVGARLKAMLAMGMSRPWPEALAAFTGEREADASAMAEYFAPLNAWLTEQNKGETCGW
jgi:peptidyl-dipeptidase A